MRFLAAFTALAALLAAPAAAEDWAAQAEHHTVEPESFEFGAGETMPVTISYYTLGTPERDADGKITNAVMLLHGTGGNGTHTAAAFWKDELTAFLTE